MEDDCQEGVQHCQGRCQDNMNMIVDQTKIVQFGPSVSVWSPEDEQMAFVPCGIVYKCPLKTDVSMKYLLCF